MSGFFSWLWDAEESAILKVFWQGEHRDGCVVFDVGQEFAECPACLAVQRKHDLRIEYQRVSTGGKTVAHGRVFCSKCGLENHAETSGGDDRCPVEGFYDRSITSDKIVSTLKRRWNDVASKFGGKLL